MNNFWVVLSHTYFSKIKSKQFILSTVVTLAILLVLANIPKIISFFDEGEGERIAVVDETNGLLSSYTTALEAINPDIQITSDETNTDKLEQRINDGDISGYIVLQLDDNDLPKASYYSLSLTDYELPSDLELALQQVKMGVAASQLNLSNDQLQILNTSASFEQIAIGENVKSQEELSQARGLVYVLLFVIYFTVIMYSNMIAVEVATEKASRVMEILISSVSPVTQMFAKILGVAFVGLTQLVIWLSVGYLSIKQNTDEMSGGFFSVFGFENIPISTLIYAVLFFLLGFFLYATMAAFLGSLVSRIEDVNQVIQPMTWFIVIGFVLAATGLATPDATYITVTSYIPFFTPMIMFLRVGLLDLPMWEPLLSIVLTIATIVVLAIFGARVYKGGVLLYGSSSALKDLKKALQLTKNQ